jgi:hypothetical protein
VTSLKKCATSDVDAQAITRKEYAKGGAVPMPSAYSKGNWKLI